MNNKFILSLQISCNMVKNTLKMSCNIIFITFSQLDLLNKFKFITQ